MRKLYIIEVGNTSAEIAAKKGDFVDWFVAGLQAPPALLAIVDPRKGEELPGYDQVAGVLVTGSHTNVTEHQPWSERVAAWLPGAVDRKIPVLGICYGHQLLAYALGGEVADNPRGLEYGTTEIFLNKAGLQDKLLGGLGDSFFAQVAHMQTVLRLPTGATLLARSGMDDHQAFLYGDCAWGLQFHPEIDADVSRAYLQINHARLLAEGQDPEKLLAEVTPTPVSAGILRRFGVISMENV